MKYFVAIDWGSSNLRAFHIVDDVLQDTYAEERGVKKIDSPSQYLTIIQSILQTFSITDKNTLRYISLQFLLLNITLL